MSFGDFAKKLDDIFTVLDKHTQLSGLIYTDEPVAGICPKCGSTNVDINYNEEQDQLAKKCKRCMFRWQEDPLDKKTK